MHAFRFGKLGEIPAQLKFLGVGVCILLAATITFLVAKSSVAIGGPAPIAIGYSALIYGKSEVTVKTRTQGEVVEVPVAEGKRLKRGQLIAQIDDRQERIDLELAQSESKLAKEDFEKSKKLEKYVSADEVVQKEAAYLKKKSIFDTKTLEVERKRIISPIDGVVTRVHFERGETVASGDKFAEVVQMDDLFLIANVPSSEASRFKTGSQFVFKVEGVENSFKATVNFTSPVIEASSDTVRVKLEAKNVRAGTKAGQDAFVLKPGMMATILKN